mmetsp:Transcript_37878/g.95206  ORF Transcript_37878/g.95206 Transcript_37878/m.95206 type:complete len:379 (-) Transcript_37878:908-2044(-)
MIRGSGIEVGPLTFPVREHVAIGLATGELEPIVAFGHFHSSHGFGARAIRERNRCLADSTEFTTVADLFVLHAKEIPHEATIELDQDKNTIVDGARERHVERIVAEHKHPGVAQDAVLDDGQNVDHLVPVEKECPQREGTLRPIEEAPISPQIPVESIGVRDDRQRHQQSRVDAVAGAVQVVVQLEEHDHRKHQQVLDHVGQMDPFARDRQTASALHATPHERKRLQHRTPVLDAVQAVRRVSGGVRRVEAQRERVVCEHHRETGKVIGQVKVTKAHREDRRGEHTQTGYERPATRVTVRLEGPQPQDEQHAEQDQRLPLARHTEVERVRGLRVHVAQDAQLPENQHEECHGDQLGAAAHLVGFVLQDIRVVHVVSIE